MQSTSTPFPPLRSIPVTRTGKYYYSLKSKDDDEVSTYIKPSIVIVNLYSNSICVVCTASCHAYILNMKISLCLCTVDILITFDLISNKNVV